MTPVELVLSKLPGARQSGKGWSARCPAHADHDPSLSVTVGDNGGVVVCCHVGCTAEAVVAAVGLTLRDLMPDRDGRASAKPARPRAGGRAFPTANEAVKALEAKLGKRSAEWVYRDTAGNPVGLVVRWDKPDGSKKDIRPVSKHPDGWRIEAMPALRPLYHLPELRASELVVVTEGEKAADAARSLGLVATTSAGGANAAGKTDWSLLTGMDVAIFPDNDSPGRRYADEVAGILANLDPPARVRVVELPGLPAGGDIVEWIAAHGDATDLGAMRDELIALVAGTEAFDPPAGGPPETAAGPSYRPFPVEVLPPVLREFVEEVAASVPCDPAFAALPALAAAGAAVGGALVVSPKRKFAEPPILWFCTVGDSGTGKSPAAKPAHDLVLAIDSRLNVAYLAAVKKYKADHKAWKDADDPDPDKEPPRPVRERFALVDVTLERLTVEAAQNPRGLVVVRDELAGWFQSFARYRGSAGGSDVPNWLSMFDGGAIRYHRRTGEPKEVEADRAFVAVSGGIQPDILRAALSDPGFIASGLAARVGFAMPPKACPRWSDRELSDETERRLARVLDFLRGLPFDPRSGPARVRLDAEALARFKLLNDEFAEAAENLDGGPMAAVLPKAVRLALRLALVWHCVAEAAAGRDPGKGSVTDEAMAAGEALARWLAAEAERVYAVMAERPEDRATRQLAEWVGRKGGRVRPRDLQRSNKKYQTTAAAELALDGLVSAGYGAWEDAGPGRGRPGGSVFVVHPRGEDDSRQKPTEPGDMGPTDSPRAADTIPNHDPPNPVFPGGNGDVSAFVGRRLGHAGANDAPPPDDTRPGILSAGDGRPTKTRYRSRPNRGVPGLDPDGGAG